MANLCIYGRKKLKRISEEQSVNLCPEFILFVMGYTGGMLRLAHDKELVAASSGLAYLTPHRRASTWTEQYCWEVRKSNSSLK